MAEGASSCELPVNSAPHIVLTRPKQRFGLQAVKKESRPLWATHGDFALISCLRLRGRGSQRLLNTGFAGLGRKSFRQPPARSRGGNGESAMATVFSVRAHAGARRFSLLVASESPLVLRAEIPEAPEDGRANRFLLCELEKSLGCSVRMLAGQKSRKKTLSADCPPEWVIERIKKQGKSMKTGESNGKDIH